MYASKVTRAALETAAQSVGVRLDLSPLSSTGLRWRVKVQPVTDGLYTPRGRRRREHGAPVAARWQRTSASGFHPDRLVSAVCWHGFRAFFRAVYVATPDALFRTAAATYRGSEDFERVHPETAYDNVGSHMYPMQRAECCLCAEDDVYAASAHTPTGDAAPLTGTADDAVVSVPDGVDDARWSDYNRKFADLLHRGVEA